MPKTTKAPKETPLMKQYNAIKRKYPRAILLFRVGDFYETFGEDAIKASKILDIVLTKRANGSASHIELAGFPYHSLDNYLSKLVRSGQRVAICDQLEDPKGVKGIVKRGVTELVTPGLSLNDQVLSIGENNYLASINFEKNRNGMAFLDLSTGEFFTAEGDDAYTAKLMQGLQPAEVIYSKVAQERYQLLFEDEYPSYAIENWIYKYDFGYQKLLQQFGTQTLKGFGIHEMSQAIVAAGAILYYLEETEHKELSHISTITRLEQERYMWLDRFSVRNLELLSPNQPDGIPLIDVLNHVVTPMGSRMLRKWVVLPLKEKTAIAGRLNRVAALVEDSTRLESIIISLKKIGDLERLVSKVATGRINPRELHQLKNCLEPIGPIKKLLAESPEKCLKDLAKSLNDHDEFMHHVTQSLTDAPPILLHQGNVIREGVDIDLDEYRSLAFSGKDYLLEIQKRESENTGITSLKIAYNKVFGYYLEVSNTHKDKVPTGWIRKQTLVNAERYITEELKVYEEKILQAESQLGIIESRLYQELVDYSIKHVGRIQEDAKLIATLDCLTNFAAIASKHRYVCPSLSKASIIDIKAGRHPVIERRMEPGESYIPNDVYLDNDSQQILVITGPNMSGKSALLRQTALIVIMAQIGSFVPAGYAKIGITDKIFTRVGASDNLSRGESTFMVEMTETASILNNLSDQSLVIMDEIGRGTSTYDGISIAWSIVEYLHNHHKAKAKTLFATHYHELNQLAGDLTRVKNFHIAVKELKGQVIFLRKLISGGTEHSFGIHVAQMAGMPNQVILRSNEILKLLEKEKVGVAKAEILSHLPAQKFQLNLFEEDPRIEQLMAQLLDVDVNNISPLDALVKLNKLKKLLKK